jgi:hypothetical protein
VHKILSIMTSELENRIKELEKGRRGTNAENIKHDIEIYELKAGVANLRRDINKQSESKKNCKFQTRCIQVAKEILNEEPMINRISSFLLEWIRTRCLLPKISKMQVAQHRFHSTSWSKNLRTLLIVIGKKDVFVWIIESFFLRYGMTKNQIVIPKRVQKLSKACLLINSKLENKISYLSFLEQCEEKGPNTFKVKHDPGIHY